MTSGEENIDELSTKLTNLQQRLKQLVQKAIEDEDAEPDCVCWGHYEQNLKIDPVEFIRKNMERDEATMDKVRHYKTKQLLGCLRFFKGTVGERKAKLIKFLRCASGYRTLNLKLLEQRLYITRKWMKENNIYTPLEDLPDMVRSEE